MNMLYDCGCVLVSHQIDDEEEGPSKIEFGPGDEDWQLRIYYKIDLKYYK
jgi:hypothetical protein